IATSVNPRDDQIGTSLFEQKVHCDRDTVGGSAINREVPVVNRVEPQWARESKGMRGSAHFVSRRYHHYVAERFQRARQRNYSIGMYSVVVRNQYQRHKQDW